MFRIEYPFKRQILSCGTEENGGFCLTKKNCAYVVNNLGNLKDTAAFERYQSEIECMRKELKIKPEIVVADLQRQGNAFLYAQGWVNKGLPLIAVQHHYAHIASCIAENGISRKVIAVVMDHTALGEDTRLWGGGFFTGHLVGFKRQAYLVSDSNVSGMVDIFDAVLELLNLRPGPVNPGQGILELQKIVNRSSHVAGRTYEFVIREHEGGMEISLAPLFNAIREDLSRNIAKTVISAAFHNTIVEIIRQVCVKISGREKIKDIVLSGVVFTNKMLLNRIQTMLSAEGFKLFTHQHFSYNDSSIAFGQAVLAEAGLNQK